MTVAGFWSGKQGRGPSPATGTTRVASEGTLFMHFALGDLGYSSIGARFRVVQGVPTST